MPLGHWRNGTILASPRDAETHLVANNEDGKNRSDELRPAEPYRPVFLTGLRRHLWRRTHCRIQRQRRVRRCLGDLVLGLGGTNSCFSLPATDMAAPHALRRRRRTSDATRTHSLSVYNNKAALLLRPP